jgi:hypothetical protein
MMDRSHTGATPDRETELYPSGIESEPPVQVDLLIGAFRNCDFCTG